MKQTISLTEPELKDVIHGFVEETINKSIKEKFRKLHERATHPNEDVMRKYYGILENKNKPVRIDEVTLDRIINKYGNNGLIYISANRSDQPEERNVTKTKELLSDIKNSGYSYLPTYGRHRGKDGVEDDYEPSFVVFNYTNNGESKDFVELKNLAIYLCEKYEQDSVLVKEPSKAPVWLDGNGEKTNSRVTKEGFEVFYNNHLKDIDFIGERHTYDISFGECYVNPMPQQLVERMRRKGEVMIWE